MKPTGEKNAIPDGWQRVRLGDVADVAFSGVDKRTVDEELPVQLCNYTDVFYNRRIRLGMDLMGATATYSERDRWTLQKGDVLFTKDSETPDEIGIPAFVVDDMPGVLCGYHLGLARPIKDVVDGEFLAEALSSGESRKQFARIANGVTRFGLTLDATKALPILLPPLPEQRAIAAVLDSVDAAIEGAKAVIATIEGLRDALLHDLLTRGLPGQHTEFRDVPGLGTIPADWDVVRLGDVAETITSGSRAWSRHFRTDGALFVRSQSIVKGRIDRSDPVFVEAPNDKEAERTRIREGDILVSITGEPGKATVADEYIGEAYVSQHVAMVRLREPQFSQYVCRSLQSSFGQEQFSRMAYGQTRPGLNLSDIGDANVALAPLAEQQAIAAVLDGVDATVEEAWEERDRLRFLKESTADALLAGRVRVGK